MAMDKKSQYFEEIRILRRKISDMEKLKDEHEGILSRLKESEKQYRILAENTLDWVFWLDPEDRLVYISPSCRRITGYTAEEFMKDGKLLFKIIHQEDRPIFEDHRRFMHKAKSHGEEEFRIVTKEGKTRWISHACHAVYDDDGDYAGILSSNCDSTDRRIMEEKLSAVDKQPGESAPVQNLIDTIEESILVIDIDGQVAMANETAAKRLGTDLKTLTQKKTWFDLLPREAVTKQRKILAEIQITGNSMRVEDEHLNQTIWNCIYPIPEKDGSIRQFAVLGIDITDRKEAEEALLENQRRIHEAFLRETREKQELAAQQAQAGGKQIQALMNAVTESFFVMDSDGKVLQANETAAKRLGTNLNSLLKRESVLGLLPSDVDKKYLQEIQRTGNPKRFEDERQQKTIWTSIYPIEDKAGNITEFAVFGIDITDRKAAEAASLENQRKIHEALLREAREKQELAARQTQAGGKQVQALMNAVTESIFISDTNGHVLYANETTAKRLGTDLKTLMKKSSIFDLLPPDVAARRKRYFEEIQKTGNPMRFEDERFDRTLWNSIYPLVGEDGAVEQFAVFGEDITDLKTAEEAVAEHQRKLDEAGQMLQQVVDAIPLRIFWKDRRSVYLGCNRLFARDAGKERPEEVVGEMDQNIAPPEQAERYRKDDLDIIAYGQPKITEEDLQVAPDGKTIRIRCTKAPLTDLNGRTIGVLGAYDDITIEHVAAEGLAESEKRYRTLFESNSLPMLLIDPETGAIEDANTAASAYYGWSREEMIHKKIYDINTLSEDALQEEMKQARLQKRNHFVFQHRMADGNIRDVEVFSGPLQFHNKTLLYSAVHDITDRVRKETVTIRSERLDSLGILAGGMAHDFNNLMTVVQGHIDVASFDLPAGHPARRALDAAQQTVEKTREITGRLITFSRGGDPILKIVRIESILENAVKSTLDGFPVDVAYEIPKDLWPVSADENQISQCFGNLAENAAEALPGGGALNISLENVDVKAKDSLPLPEGPYVRIVFEDTGKGIAAENLSRIFDPYFSTKPKGKHKGMGLGLAVCYSVMKKHNGYITVASEEGQGASVSLYLPAKPLSSPSDAEKEANGAGAAKKRILVMDDNEPIRNLLQLFIEQLGYDVATVADGQQALAEYTRGLEESKPYRAVILEVSVRQGWDGDVALMKLQNMNPDIKAIAVISDDRDLNMDEYKQRGFCNVLSKPFRLEQVRQVLDDILKA